jgi:hypothetical protein
LSKNFQKKSDSLSSLLPEQDIKFNVEKLSTEYYRETKSALKAIVEFFPFFLGIQFL